MIKNLKTLRQKYNISQQKLGDIIGVSQQSINKYENHKIEPDINTLIAIAEFFDTSIDYLVGKASDEPVDTYPYLHKYKMLSDKQKEMVNMLIDSYYTD